MAAIALFMHAERPEALELAAELIHRLESGGHRIHLAPEAATALGRSESGFFELGPVPEDGSSTEDGIIPEGEIIPEDGSSAEDGIIPEGGIGDRLDLAVSLGGDGSMLRAVTAVSDRGVPVMGVNYGSLGYLTDVQPEDAMAEVERFLAGDYETEERLRLSCKLDDGTEGCALNEVIVEKLDSGRTVSLAVHIDGEYFTSYAADGLIAATPTGSTAYSLSAGGPILAPTMSAVILTPVAPHTLFDRSLVLLPSSELVIEVLENRPAAVAVDGRSLGQLGLGNTLTVAVSEQPARLVTGGRRGFHQALKSSFGLPDRRSGKIRG